jgi:cold shock CspA family protein
METGLTGCVKWFNNHLNYGFITVVSEGDYKNVDIFVHQSNIKTKQDCFRTLYTNECVSFDLAKSDNAAHPIHAINVSGFNGAQLHCETSAPRPHTGSFRGGYRGSFRGGRGGFRSTNRQFTSNDNAGHPTTVQTQENAQEAHTVVENTGPIDTKPTRGRGKRVAKA